MVYVYDITDSPLPALSFEVGVGNEPLSVISSGCVAAVFSEHAGGTVRPTADNVWRHEQIVERLMRDRNRAVLPARFGTLLGDDAKLPRHSPITAAA